MQSEFRAACEAARAGIVVPDIPLAAIRDAAGSSPMPSKRRKRVIAGILCVFVIAGAATAAEFWKGTHVGFGPSGALRMSTTGPFHYKLSPTPDDLRDIARQAAFTVHFPSGLPAGTTIAGVGYGPSIILVDYNLPGAWRRSNHLLRIVLADPRTLTTSRAPHAFMFKIGGLAASGSLHWHIGGELVIVMRSLATPRELQEIKRAMMRK